MFEVAEKERRLETLALYFESRKNIYALQFATGVECQPPLATTEIPAKKEKPCLTKTPKL